MRRYILTLTLAATAFAASHGQTKRMAVIGFSESYLREQPAYTAELGTQALMGSVVEIVAEEGYWKQVVTSEPYTAWCTDLGLVEMKHDRLAAYIAAPKYICTALHSTVRKGASMEEDQISDLAMGCLVRVVMTEGKKPKPSVRKGWAEVMLPDGRKGWTPLADLESFEKWAQKPKPSENRIIATAKMFIGTPYLWGGASSKGLDCSGLVRLTWFMNGYLLPRNASQQVHLGREIIVTADHSITRDSEKFYDEMCRRIENLKPGDLVFFGNPETRWKKESITHVGIYIGNGEIIHASHKVRINSLIPGKSNYYENAHRLLKARRLFDWKGEGLTPISQSKAYNL
jgi:cell wall-associated NlpC family hydrolase